VYLGGEPVQVTGEPAGRTAYLGQLRLPGGPGTGHLIALLGRDGQRGADVPEGEPRAGGDRLGDPGTPGPGRPPGRGPFPGGPLGCRLPASASARPASRTHPFLAVRTARRTSISFCRACGTRAASRSRSALSGSSSIGVDSASWSRSSKPGEAAQALLTGLPQRWPARR